MGIIFSRFRKKKTTLELLQKLEDQIKDIEEYSSNTEQRYKKIVRQLLVYSLGLYVLLGVFCYFYLAISLKQKIIYCLLLVLSPIIFFFVKKLISWYYVRKINTNQSKLAEMKQEKKRLLEEVMDKETYKVAKDILEKFAPETLPRKPQPLVLSRMSNVQNTPLLPPPEGLRRRSGIVNPDGESSRPSLPPSVTGTPRNSVQVPTPALPSLNKPATGSAMLPLPAPILPRERTYLDRVVEYLIGDGPANRYALICSQCQSHNGMALKEEFEYIGFRCCYCFSFNPARKQRPEAPKLETEKNAAEAADSESDESCLASSDESAQDRDRSDTEDTRGAFNDTLGTTVDNENDESNDTIQQKEVGSSNKPSKKFSPPIDENACFSPVSYSESESTSVFPSNIKKTQENLVETDLEHVIDKGDTAELSSTTNDIELIDLGESRGEKVDHIDSENKEILDNNDSTSEVLQT